jgi:hypothetical protein
MVAHQTLKKNCVLTRAHITPRGLCDHPGSASTARRPLNRLQLVGWTTYGCAQTAEVPLGDARTLIEPLPARVDPIPGGFWSTGLIV